jgi:methylthioribose-1-phosphate isomerase
MKTLPKTLEWIGGIDGFLRILDQTRLPNKVVFRDCKSVKDVWNSIRRLRIRGAPAIGVAAAYGVVTAMRSSPLDQLTKHLNQACDYLATSRPTAVNLFWALERMRGLGVRGRKLAANPDAFRRAILREAKTIEAEDRAMARAIGENGADLVPNGGGVLTHCNAGSLVSSGRGTALSLLTEAHRRQKRFRVFVDETRPLLQGARLTAWELMQHGLDATLICDNMAAQVMREGKVQMVVVGADRIAANGDTANKIGTYGVALLAHAHGIPFYVAAPSSTFDLSLQNGDAIPIEQRAPREITHGFGRATAPEGVQVYNPAFDVTPARLIAGIVTERGVIRPVDETQIRQTLTGSQN